ncbi:SMP-30/gluconolactonase/LRE family protein [Pseudonocardia sp.]|uniref:SMP-30/gluconolactonase/LRE family protein n=1 Tax=Pseudonocardia sp. TaxID=60912 RepID=UPI003D1185C4
MARVVLEGMSFLEGPRWRDGRLWLSDFYTHRVVSLREDGSDLRVEAEVEGQPSGLGWLPDGRLLVTSMRDRRVLRREPDGTLAVHAELGGHAGGHANDLVVDAHGRTYVGNFGFDLMSGADLATTSLVRVDPDGTVTVAAPDVYFPNGATFLPDGTLVLSETFGNRVSAFDVGPDGQLSGRRDWVRFGDLPSAKDVPTVLGELAVAPDGMSAADAEGAVWIADALGNRVLRITEGRVLGEISTGEVGVYACVLGGADGRTLFCCTAPGFAEHERRETREAKLLAFEVEVPIA